MQPVVAVVPPRIVAAVRRRAMPQTIAGLIRGSDVWELMRARGIESTGHNVVIYRDEPGHDLMHSRGGIPVEIGAEVLAPFEPDDAVACVQTPGGRCISIVHLGPVARLRSAYDAILSAVGAQELRLAGPYWEVYGHWTADPDEFETKVFYALSE